MSEPIREPIEPPDGFEQSPLPGEPSSRPDWLMGADDNADIERQDRPRPILSRPRREPEGPESEPIGGARSSFRRETQRPAAPEPEPTEDEEESTSGWSAAASSVPRLTVSSRGERPAVGEDDDAELLGDEDEDPAPEIGSRDPADPQEPPPVELPHEPWWLVAVETITTNRPIQIGIAAVLVAVAAWVFWPRKENQTVAIAAIKSHPERFEGQPVRVRGEVGEVFDVGSGVVFHFHQRRDTMVVFSRNRRPAPRERLVILGTVSTGYLDGTPRVALFESSTTPQPR